MKTFPCTSCGAKLEFAPGAQSLKCPYCGAQNEIPASDEAIEELDFHAWLDDAAAHEDVLEAQTVKCGSCGAASTFDPEVTASKCPFCGTQMVLAPQTTRLIRPKSLLPFGVNKSQATEAFRKWIGGLWFAPNDLKKYARMEGAFSGMYIPYWTFDSEATTRYSGERGDDYQETETYTEDGETRTRTVTKTRWRRVSGTVHDSFDDVCVVASNSLPRDKTEELEPWDLENLLPYQDAYLSGFQAEAYQVDLKQGFDRAREIMAQEIAKTIRRDIGGDHQRIHSMDTDHANITFKHILLPVWVNAYQFRNKVYNIVINGRTAEVQGERPWSVAKIALAVAGALVGGGLIYGLIQYFGG